MRRCVKSDVAHRKFRWILQLKSDCDIRIRFPVFVYTSSNGVWQHSSRHLHTPPGGFEEDLPNSFGRSASDKGKGQGLSTVNSRIKNRLRRVRHKQKLLIPQKENSPHNAPESKNVSGNASSPGCQPHVKQSSPSGEPIVINGKKHLQNGESSVDRERLFTEQYGGRPVTTVFGSDLDRLEEDYLRDYSQIGERLQKKRHEMLSGCFLSKENVLNSSLPSPLKGKQTKTSFQLWGAGRQGRRLRWSPSSSFAFLNQEEPIEATDRGKCERGDEYMDSEFQSKKHEDEGLPYDYGTLGEQRRRMKRDKHLTVGSSTNHHLSAHYMAAMAVSDRLEQSAEAPCLNERASHNRLSGPQRSMDNPKPRTLRWKHISNRESNKKLRASFPDKWTVEGEDHQSTGEKSEISAAHDNVSFPHPLPFEGDLPSESNPHFPSMEESSSALSDAYDARGTVHGENDYHKAPLTSTSSTSSSSSSSLVPALIRVNNTRPTPFLESRQEERFYSSSDILGEGSLEKTDIKKDNSSSSNSTPSYNAYSPRPWEDSLPVLRSANYWDENPTVRKELEEQLDHEAKLFQQEQLAEGTVDTSEVEYSTQKLRKEMLLYYQAHPINEMITESYVRIREIYPARRTLQSTHEQSKSDEVAGAVLRYHPESLRYPTEWLCQQRIEDENEEDAIALLKARDSETQSNESDRNICESSFSHGRSVLREADDLTKLANTENEKKDIPHKTNNDEHANIHLTSSEETPKTDSDTYVTAGNGTAIPKLEVAVASTNPTLSYNDALEQAVEYLFKDYDVPLSVARHLATRLGLDLIQISSLYTSKSDRRIIALCAIGDHREHLRQMIRFKLQKLGIQPPPTMPCIEVPFKGGTHPHAVRVKAVGIAKRLLHRHVVRIQLTKFGTPREGFAVLQTILDEIRHQCEAVHAYHTAGKIQSTYHEIYCFLYPSTGKSPKSTVRHPSPEELRNSRDLRILADEKEIYFDDFHNLPTHKERLRYAKKIADGTAWAEKDEGLSLQRQRAIKVMLGYLPKGNKEMYAARGDVNIPAPFRTSHPTGVDRWSSPPPFDNLEQASRGAAVLGKRASMPISEMHDSQETEDQPSTLDRFYYRVQGSALEVGELKEALGLKENRKRGIPLGPGFATLSSQTRRGSSPQSAEEPHFTVH